MLDRIRITRQNLDAIKAKYRYRFRETLKASPLKKGEFYAESTPSGVYAVFIVDDFDEIFTTEDLELLNSIHV